MAEALFPTLVLVRERALARAGVTTEGGAAAPYYPIALEKLREAQNTLIEEASWTRLRRRFTQPLVDGVHEYDIPDLSTFSMLERVTVLSTTGQEYDLAPGAGAQVRNAFHSKGLPAYFEFQNDEIRVEPAPDASRYPTMVIDAWLAAGDLNTEQERVVVHEEALIQRAALLIKEHLGIGGEISNAWKRHYLFVDTLAMKQGETGGNIPIAPVPRAPTYRSLRSARHPWNPW